jgi:hypothetical protein
LFLCVLLLEKSFIVNGTYETTVAGNVVVYAHIIKKKTFLTATPCAADEVSTVGQSTENPNTTEPMTTQGPNTTTEAPATTTEAPATTSATPTPPKFNPIATSQFAVMDNGTACFLMEGGLQLAIEYSTKEGKVRGPPMTAYGFVDSISFITQTITQFEFCYICCSSVVVVVVVVVVEGVVVVVVVVLW